MGMAGHAVRPQHPARRASPPTRRPTCSQPNPREVSRRLMTRHELIAGDVGQRAGRGLAAVHDPRLVQPREEPDGRPVGRRPRPPTTPGPSTPMLIMRTMADPTRPASARRRRRPRINVLRTGGTPRRSTAPAPRSTQAAPQPARTASCGSATTGSLPLPDGPDDDPTRGARLLDRAGACCRRCSPSSTTPSATGCARRYPDWNDEELFQRARLDQRRADRQDPHRRVDAGGHQPPDDRDGAARQLVRAGRRAAPQRCSAGSAAARWSAASPARRPSTTACRSR